MPTHVEWMLSAASRAIALLAMALLSLAGCNSDPACQQAISNLRAEKIQLENQYYELKSRREADAHRLGQPDSTYSPADPTPELMFEGPIGSDNPSQPTLAIPNRNSPNSADGVDPSRFIRQIEISQLPADRSGELKLLVRPLDKDGFVIPVPGDLRIELFALSGEESLARHEFQSDRVASMVEYREEHFAGIHVALPVPAQAQAGAESLQCRVHFRGSDQRVQRQQAELALSASSNRSVRSVPNRVPTSPSSASPELEELDVPDVDGVRVEIGDESNLQSLPINGQEPPMGPEPEKRPVWTPYR